MRRRSGNANKGAAHNRFKHGLTGTPTYKAWSGMKRRCYAAHSIDFKNYGARGIKVCDRWLDSFDSFLADMGVCPPGLSIDRINNDGNYEPSNCRWADRVTQSRNRSFSHVTQEIADQIRKDRAQGQTFQHIADTRGVSLSHCHRIVNREAWA